MAVLESEFCLEAELQEWVFANLRGFLGECIHLGSFQITTSSGKGGVPDGFAFNFAKGEWCLIECELLKHGVWPHIAEQITRFVVALQNPDTLRTIRDRLFDNILSTDKTQCVAADLNTTVEKLLQQIELFIEGNQPNVVIFIDDTNQDLTDFAHALATPVQVYRVKKLLVDGKTECYSPDRQAPIVTTSPEPSAASGSQDYAVVEQLGGGTLLTGQRGFACYQLEDGRIIHVKRSKYYERKDGYWYGVNPNALTQAEKMNVTHFVFVLGDWGFAVVPIAIVKAFCAGTGTTNYPDGSVRHYHVLISAEPELEMFWSKDVPRYDLTEYCHQLD